MFNFVNTSAFLMIYDLHQYIRVFLAFMLSRFKISLLIFDFDIIPNVNWLSLVFSLIALMQG